MKLQFSFAIGFLFGLFAISTSGWCYDVGPNGSFNYSIDINLPPAPAKHQPNLKLVYNSDFGGELFGPGWSMLGLPTIRRIDFGDGVRFAGADTYAGPE